ncbi:hypothetical protein pb186bvf_001026 [Paramecium bursaria]
MENIKSQSNQYVKQELEGQLRTALIEIKALKKENQQLLQQCQIFKEKSQTNTKMTDLYQNLELKYKQLIMENKQLQIDLDYYTNLHKEQSTIQLPDAQILQTELDDIQKYFKSYFSLQERLHFKFNQSIALITAEGLLAINQLVFQDIVQYKLDNAEFQRIIRIDGTRIQIVSALIKLKIICKGDCKIEQRMHDLRVEIERTRKDIQQNQHELKQLEKELQQLNNEFTYTCKIEARRFNQQLDQEKQLIQIKQKTESAKENFVEEYRLRQQSDHYKPQNRSLIQFKTTKQNDDYIKAQSQEDQSIMEKTIEQTRKKLSRQLSLAQNIKN